MLYQYLLLRARIQDALTAEEGQDIIEYVLIAGFIALAAIVALPALRTALANGWAALAAGVTTATTAAG